MLIGGMHSVFKQVILSYIYVHARQMFLNLDVFAFMSTYSNILCLCIVCSSKASRPFANKTMHLSCKKGQ